MEAGNLSNTEQMAPQLSSEEKERKDRTDWEENQVKIQEAIIELRGKLKRFPRLLELKEATSLSVATIERHIASLKNNSGRFEAFRTLTERVAMAMYDGAVIDRDAKCMKLWYQIVEGWTEHKKVTNFNANPYSGRTDEDLKKALAEKLSKAKGGCPAGVS